MTATHADRAALLQTILEYPEEDFPRLAFADWLDERGEHERAAECREPARWMTYLFAHRPPMPSFIQMMNENPTSQDYVWRTIPVYVRIRYGFWDRIEMTCADFMKHAEELFSQHPITRVVLTDKRPTRFMAYDYFQPDRESEGWEFRRESDRSFDESVPEPIWLLIDRNAVLGHRARYPTESAAIDALSAACVAYGRELAGLRPLTKEKV